MKRKTSKKLESMHSLGATVSAPSLEKKRTKKSGKSANALPEMVSEASERSSGTTTMRRDVAGTIERTDRFANIDNGLVPFRNSNAIYGPSASAVDIRDAVILCQKCYWNFALFRNIIDLMTEFSIDDILWRGGNKQSRSFFEALFNKIGIWDLQDKFFREYYRSGNVFIYRFDADVQPGDVKKIIQSLASKTSVGNPVMEQNQPMGAPENHMGYPTGNPKDKTGDYNPLNQEGDIKLIVEPMKMPARYIILNPADINMLGTANFSYGIYYKVLTEYEVSRLRNLQTEEDIEVYNSLPKFTQDQIRAGVRSVYIPLDTKKVKIVFYKKQDYEPFAVPMGYPVLEDINAKIEMRRIDMAITRTMQQIVLLVTCGAKPEDGGINQKNIDALKKIFTNQSVGRVLVADYTTKADFIIPKIGELLDPQKYEIIDKDINIGLNNVFLGGEKFANQQKKVEIFVKRLEQAKKAFLEIFLIPEIKRISKSLNFKNYPTPYFDENQFKDDVSYAKVYTQLVSMGVLTPEQGIEAIQNNRLPEADAMQPAQEKYKEDRANGLYVPLIPPPQAEGDSDGPSGKPSAAGRPAGSTGPQGTKKITPMGAKGNTTLEFSTTKLIENMSIAQDSEKGISTFLKKKYKVKKLNEIQESAAADILTVITANEEPEKWTDAEVIKEYCETRVDKNQSRVNRVLGVAAEHQVDNYLASLLYSSRKQ